MYHARILDIHSAAYRDSEIFNKFDVIFLSFISSCVAGIIQIRKIIRAIVTRSSIKYFDIITIIVCDNIQIIIFIHIIKEYLIYFTYIIRYWIYLSCFYIRIQAHERAIYLKYSVFIFVDFEFVPIGPYHDVRIIVVVDIAYHDIFYAICNGDEILQIRIWLVSSIVFHQFNCSVSVYDKKIFQFIIIKICRNHFENRSAWIRIYRLSQSSIEFGVFYSRINAYFLEERIAEIYQEWRTKWNC